MRHHPAQRDGGYALILTVMIGLIVGGLAVTLVGSTHSGLRQSRRSGDSANALQVADAGINAAVKKLTDYTGGSPLVVEAELGTGDKYRVVATKESSTVWHLDGTGTDSNGTKRRVKATAVAEPLFANAVFAKTTVNFGSGVAVDSFSGGMTQAETCLVPGKGFVGTNDPAANDINVQGGGGGVRNCTSKIPNFPVSTGYVYDGCVGYADEEPVPKFKNESMNATKHTCGTIMYRTPKYDIDLVDTTGLTLTAASLDCSGPLNLPPGKYFYHSITLRNGCKIPASNVTQENPVKLYTDGALNIGSGANDVVNAPSSTCPGTSPTGTDYYTGTAQNPLWYYCPGWPGRTQIFVAGGAPATVNFANHVRFWGVILAPQRAMGGGPQAIVWGAFAANSIASGAQFSVHYDEALSVVTTGRFKAHAWRESPQ